VAPGASGMSADAIDCGGGIQRTVDDALLSFEWMIDPDGDPSTNFDVPDVCSNSWGLLARFGFPLCDQGFWSSLDALEAVGCVILFSAGNEGFSEMRRPADRATDDFRTLAVGAVDAENFTFPWPIAGFSARGPTNCTPNGTPAIKPDISAPGVNVDSARPGGGYRRLSGTSMASPHVNGVVALIRQACPDLTVPEVKQVLFDSAVDLGAPGEDNTFGWGNINAEAAVLLALDRCVGFALGDLNCDGVIDAGDIDPFLVALFDPEQFPILYPDCNISLGDINGDGNVNAGDIEGFINLLFP
ncbi:MAG: S8 family serine peptidase, partial [Planctomycetes bacterium]|nr:S8 family serine peptidase [Planctomycetota bacterium]